MTITVTIKSPGHESTFSFDDFKKHINTVLHSNTKNICPQYLEIIEFDTIVPNTLILNIDYFGARNIYLAYCEKCCEIVNDSPVALLIEPLRDFEISTAMMSHIISTCISQSIMTITIVS